MSNKKINKVELNGDNLTIDILKEIVFSRAKVIVGKSQLNKVHESFVCLDNLIRKGKIMYGVNTNMGGMRRHLISPSLGHEVQMNLLRAVSSNVGEFFDEVEVRAAMLARIHSLARGKSAIRVKNFKIFVDMLNKGIHPFIPQKGSLGTSGDLGPLAVIALAATGEGWVKYQGKKLSAAQALKRAKINPMKLTYKEGLALINGTSMMVGVAALVVNNFEILNKSADIVGAFSVEALRGKVGPFDPRVHIHKPHIGQQITAQNIFQLIKQSNMAVSEKELQKILKSNCSHEGIGYSEVPVLDSYSIRCIPQVHGPVKEICKLTKTTIENELNSSNDDPLVLPEHEDCFHNGHFHGQYVSASMDQIAIGATTLGLISDRRIDLFLDKNHSAKLPAFLCDRNQETRLGLMGCAFLTASLVAECRAKCTPISIQSVPSTEDFQDFVSFGLVSARRSREIVYDIAYILAIELICAAQGADIRGIKKLSIAGKKTYEWVRMFCPFFSKDKSVTPYVERVAEELRNGALVKLHPEVKLG